MIKTSRLFILSILILTLCLSLFTLDLQIPTVKADAVNSGFNFFTNWIDISLAGAGAWTDVDVSAHVPVGATGVMLELVNVGAGIQGYDVRHPASVDDDYEVLHLYTDNHAYAYVGINSSYYFEMYIGSTDIDCYLLGYTDSAVVFFDSYVDYALGTALAWTDIDVSGYVPSGATGTIWKIVSAGANYETGVRHPSSTDNFHTDQRIFSFQMCGVNSSRMIQGYVENLGADHKLVGYTTAPVTFKVDWVDISLGGIGAWTDIDVTASTIAGATGVIVYDHLTTANWRASDIREDLSTNDQYANSDNYAGGPNFMGCGLATGEILEGQIENLDVDFYLVAYTEEATPSTDVYPDHVESSYLVTNATHTLERNNTYATIEADGWIIWDFASSIENVTAINWDLMAGSQHTLFRLDASNDLSDWTILAQTSPSDTGLPPSTNYKYTRYDSEIHTRWRYFRYVHLKGIISPDDWYIDSFWLTVQPPAINYSDGSYVYPTELQYFNWEIYGSYPLSTAYASIPYTTLGKNMTATLDTNWGYNESLRLVNADFDADNYLIVKFNDYYNITSAYFKGTLSGPSGHAFFYMSTTGQSDDWTLIWDLSGAGSPQWYGNSINGTRIRYLKLNCTDVGDNDMRVEAFRIEGSVHSGSGGGTTEDYDWSFYLFPDWLSDALGIPLLAGQLLASACVLACILLPFAFYERRSFWATIIIGLVVFAFLVALGWLPTWLMLLLVLLIAGLFGLRFSKWFGGK